MNRKDNLDYYVERFEMERFYDWYDEIDHNLRRWSEIRKQFNYIQ